MTGNEFFSKVYNKEIKNNTEFDVYDLESKKLGTVKVEDASVLFVNMNFYPTDLYSENYIFKMKKDNARRD